MGDLVEGYAAPSALVTAEVVPYRPNRGMYLVVELPDDPSAPPAWAPEHVEALLDIDGVAGMWTFTASTLRPDRFDSTGYSITACYLDGDPVEVAKPIADVFTERWDAHARHARARGAVRDDARLGVGPLRPPGLSRTVQAHPAGRPCDEVVAR